MDKLDLVIQRIDDLKESNNDRLSSIDGNLAEHMRRTNVLEELHMDNQTRIQLLEEPKIALKIGKSVLLWVGTLSGTILGLFKLIDTINK